MRNTHEIERGKSWGPPFFDRVWFSELSPLFYLGVYHYYYYYYYYYSKGTAIVKNGGNDFQGIYWIFYIYIYKIQDEIYIITYDCFPTHIQYTKIKFIKYIYIYINIWVRYSITFQDVFLRIMEIKYKVVNKNNNHFSTSMRMIWCRVTQPLENIAGWEIDNPISYHSERRVAAKFIILFIFFCVKAPNKQPTSIHFCVG